MKEIGGYIEFGSLINNEYHKQALKFNSSRSALRYFIKKNNIKKIYLPYYLCRVVYDALKNENIEITFYHINNDFTPLIENYDLKSYIYIVNYYGLLSNKDLLNLHKKYQRIIIDNTHAFFRKPLTGICTIYNCRKYFGVPDGAYLYSNLTKNNELETFKVQDKLTHLIGRLEQDASTYYKDFSNNDQKFSTKEIYQISKFSQMLLGALNYKDIYLQRKLNYQYLKKHLAKYERLSLPNILTFMYPLYIPNGKELREYLISKKIYIPKFWPDIVNEEALNDIEKDYINNIIPIPIDQRYNLEDMEKIIEVMEEKLCIN